MHILDAECNTKEYSVVDTSTNIEIVWTNISSLLTVQQIPICEVIARYTFVVNYEIVVIKVIELTGVIAGSHKSPMFVILNVESGLTCIIVATKSLDERQRILWCLSS